MPKFLVSEVTFASPVTMPNGEIKPYVNSSWAGYRVRIDTSTREILVEQTLQSINGTRTDSVVCVPLENVKVYRRSFQKLMDAPTAGSYSIADAPDE